DWIFISQLDWAKLKRRWPVFAVYGLIALAVVIKILSVMEKNKVGIGFSVADLSPQVFFFTQMNVIVKYIALLFYPIGLNLEYDFPLAHSLWEFPTIFSSLGHAALILYALTNLRARPLLAYAILWFYLALVPSSSVVPVVDVIFEHHTYLPSIG